MTLYGIDVSNNNGAGIDMMRVAAEGFSFVFAKVSEGDYFSDATWPAYRDAARAAGLTVVGYHYMIAGCDPAAQVARFIGNGGGSVAMIDQEDNSGDITEFWAMVQAFDAAGVKVAAAYLPQWYWRQIGSPDLSRMPAIIASAYPGGTGYASQIYENAGGDLGAGWASYGGMTPQFWQFTDQAAVARNLVDVSAFRGSLAELTALLTGGEMDLNTPIENGAGATVGVGFMMAATDYHGSMALDELCGPGTSDTVSGTLVPTGHPQLGGRTVVNALAKIGAHLGIAGFVDPDGAQS